MAAVDGFSFAAISTSELFRLHEFEPTSKKLNFDESCVTAGCLGFNHDFPDDIFSEFKKVCFALI